MRKKTTPNNSLYQSYLSVGKNLPPEDLKEYEEWLMEEIENLNQLKQKSIDSLVGDYAMLMWVCKKYEQMVSEDLKQKEIDHIQELEKRKKSLLALSFAAAKFRERDFNLASGRSKGTKLNKNKAQQNLHLITKSIDDLFANGIGFQKNYPEIATFLIERKISPYKHSTTLQKVKAIAPKIKQKYKSGQ